MVTALVTGGAGFIGSHLVELLVEQGNSVRVIDNYSSGRVENLQSVAASKRLSVYEADVRDASAIEPIFDGVDWVFHLAALADIVPSINSPEKYFRTNVDGTFCVMQAARRAGAKRVIYAASASRYGIPDIYPTPETAPAKPQYPYALTKHLGEEIVQHWSMVYRIPSLALRLFNVYGPRSRTSGTYGAVFGVFIAQMLAGKPLTIVGDGLQARDFVYVKDVARAFVAAAGTDLTGMSLNVGTGNPQSVNRLAELIGGETTNIPRRPGEPDLTHADISMIKQHVGWEPSVSFEDGVRAVLANADYWKTAPVWTPESIKHETADWFKYLGDPAAK